MPLSLCLALFCAVSLGFAVTEITANGIAGILVSVSIFSFFFALRITLLGILTGTEPSWGVNNK